MTEAVLANVNREKLHASLRFLDKQGEMTFEILKENGNDVTALEKLDELFQDEAFVIVSVIANYACISGCCRQPPSKL